MKNSEMILKDLNFISEIITNEQQSLSGGAGYDPKTPNDYGYYEIPKQKYNCFKYYEPKWGGTFYKCYIDGKAPKGNADPDSGRGGNSNSVLP
jgi:hypothetical protein